MDEILNLVTKGGWLLAPIGVCSIVALAFFLERLWRLQRTRVLPQRFLDLVEECLEEGRLEEARTLCESNDSPIANMLQAAIEHAGCDRSTIKEVLTERGQREVFYLERFVNALGAIATISPLLGLLGTVVGMIRVFQNVVSEASGGGQIEAAVMAGGIWEALVTTAAGLAVAIPVYLAYRYILGRVDQYAVELEEVSLEAIEYLVPAEQSAIERGELSDGGEA